jgi:DNA-binding XRE family transcriptional regulator
MSKYLIYALRSIRDQDYKYIGKSSSGLERPKMHLNYSHNESVRIWVQELKTEGYFPIIDILEECDEENIDHIEQKWIKHYLSLGHILFNIHQYQGRELEKIKNNIKNQEELLEKELTKAKEAIYSLEDIGLFIKIKRKERKITQLDLAELSGLTSKSISEIELGTRNPTLAAIKGILDALGYKLVPIIKFTA